MTSRDRPDHPDDSYPPLTKGSPQADGFERARLVFQDAIHVPKTDRDEFLREVCVGDTVLRQEVEELLRFHDRENVPLDSSIIPLLDEHALSGERLGHYVLGEPLGEGGMGVVYQARDDRTNANVAVKVLRQNLGSRAAATRFRLESHTLQRLSGQGIARLLDSGTARHNGRDLSYYVMEEVKGTSLDRLEANGDRATVELLTRLCEAVAEAHAQGVIHRDLKPENIIVREDGQPVVLDFGIARTIDPEGRTTNFATSTGHVMGTVAYMSPEQLTGDNAATGPPSDVYSLGVIAFELLTGTHPHECANRPKNSLTQAGALQAIERQDAPLGSSRRPDISGSLDAILFKALERMPGDRYANAGKLAADFAAYLQGAPVAAPSQTRMRQIWNRARRAPKRTIAITLIALSLLLVAGGISMALQDRQEDALVELKLTELWSLFNQVNQDLHDAGSRTEESIHKSIATLEECREVLRSMPKRPHSARLLRFIDWRSGEARYFLGARTHNVLQLHIAAGHWTDAHELAMTHDGTLEGLDRGTRIFNDIKHIDLAVLIGGRGLAYSSISMFEDRAQFLHRAVIARRSSLHFHNLNFESRREPKPIPLRMAILNYGATLIDYGIAVDSLSLVEQGIEELATVREEDDWGGFRSAFASMEYTVGLGEFYRWQKSNRPEDLDAAAAQFHRSLGIRGEGSGSSLHVWDRMELARIELWRVRRSPMGSETRAHILSARENLAHARVDLSRAKRPMEYASIDLLDAQLTAELGGLDADASAFADAESLLTAAEVVFSREHRPLQHAELQMGRVLVLEASESLLGERTSEIRSTLGIVEAIVPGSIWPWLRHRAERYRAENAQN